MATAPAILLVDDDVELLKALTKVLEKEGYAVTAKPEALSALTHVNNSQPQFDVVITDVSMPGMSGTEFLSALQTVLPAVPVIIITAFGDWGGYMDALRQGAFAYLNKPLDRAELVAAIRRALANGTAPPRQSATV